MLRPRSVRHRRRTGVPDRLRVDEPRSTESFDEFGFATSCNAGDLGGMPGTYRGQSAYFDVDKNTGPFVVPKPSRV